MSIGVLAIGTPLPRSISILLNWNFLYWKGWHSIVDPRKNLFLTIQRVNPRTGSVPKIFSLTKQFCPAWMMKPLFRLSIYGYTAGLFVEALSVLTLTAPDKLTLLTNKEALSITTAYCLVNSLDVCCLPRSHLLDCATVWWPVKSQMECNTWQQKPFRVQKVYVWCSIQFKIELFALSEFVQLFLLCFCICLVIRSIPKTLTGAHVRLLAMSVINSVSINPKWW